MYEAASVYGIIGNGREAVRYLREFAATGFSRYSLFARDSFLDPIRDSPEFIQFMSEQKPQYDRRSQEFAGLSGSCSTFSGASAERRRS